jgi:predicted Rdx family selenoprotein
LCSLLLTTQSVELNVELLFDRATEERFQEVKEIKQLIRDKLVPDKDLGHSDIQEQIGEVDDDEAEEQRKFFGVA